MQGRKGCAAVLLGAAFGILLTTSAARAGSGGAVDREPYVPLFVMYSGGASPEQLTALKQFLAKNAVPGEAIEDALETVVFKLQTFKAGFAYPVFHDDRSTAGNACVVADSRHAGLTDAWTLLASERVYKPLLPGGHGRIETKPLLENVFNHELFHCYDAARHSLEELGQQVVRFGPKYYAYWGEAGADAYAALQHLRQGGDRELLRRVRDYRTLNLLNGDTVHYTAGIIEYILWTYNRQALQGMTTRQLIALTDRIRAEHALSPREFARMAGAAAGLSEAYDRLIAGYPGLAPRYGGELMRPDAREVSAAHGTDLFLQVRAALWRLGGDVDGAYFAPLEARFAPAAPSRAG